MKFERGPQTHQCGFRDGREVVRGGEPVPGRIILSPRGASDGLGLLSPGTADAGAKILARENLSLEDQDTRADRSAQPAVSGGGVQIAAEILEINLDLTKGVS